MKKVQLLANQTTENVMTQLCQLQFLCFQPPWSANQIQRQLENLRGQNYLLLSGQKVLGYIFYQVLFEQVELLQIGIDPKQQRLGHARVLLQQSIHSIQQTVPGVETLLLEVRASNSQAIALYETFGFSLDGERRNYYPSQVRSASKNAARENAQLYSLNIKQKCPSIDKL